MQIHCSCPGGSIVKHVHLASIDLEVLLQIGAMMLLFLARLKRKRLWLHVATTLNAWSALDVFVVSVVVSVLQIGQFVAFIVENPFSY